MKKFDLKVYEYCFLIGLLAYTAGQFLIFVFFNDIDALHAQEPIDFAHWSMLIGVLLLLPQATNFPKFNLNLVGTPLLILGIGLTVGMCVLDFVFWSIKSPELKGELAFHLIGSPAIWGPFMILSGKIFNLGLLISSFSYFNISKTGPLLVLLGTFIIYAGGGWLNVLGYLVLTAGFSLCFYKQNLAQEP
jgi:peptidoglycan/LPS O-acetylase OafA/YrhL